MCFVNKAAIEFGTDAQGNLEERKDSADPQSNVFGSLLTTFGSVEVGGRNFFKLMQNGECVLLYPGGVREVRTVTALTYLLAATLLLLHFHPHDMQGDKHLQMSS